MTSIAAPRLVAAYPQVFVTDMARAVAFYRDRLGYRVVYLYGEPAFYGQIGRDGAALNLRHVDAPVLDPALRDRETLLAANIPTEAVDALHREFDTRGVPFAQPLKARPWGTTDFIIRDPDGNLICFASVV